MFLRTIGEAKLLPTNELYVLKHAPPSTTLPLAKTMVDYLRKSEHESATLLSKDHVDWVMQILGHSFNLPIQGRASDVISGAIDIYKRWMSPNTQPKPIKRHSHYFTKKMCCHLSFIFKKRGISPTSTDFNIHTKLCQRVLGIYSKSARNPPNGVKSSEWNEFLCRIFLGICGEIMKGPADGKSLGNEIEQDVYFCFFDIWLRAQIQSQEMWNLLNIRACKDWIHRNWFLESWGRSCLALSRRLMYMLYGGDNGSDLVFVFWPVLGTRSLSINAMLTGRGSMLAPSSQTSISSIMQLTSPKSSDKSVKFSSNRSNRFSSNNDNIKGSLKNHNNNLSTSNISHHHQKSQKKFMEVAYMQGQTGKFGTTTSTAGTHSGGRVLSMATGIHIDEPRLLIYLWNQMLSVLDLNAINDPECFGIATAWIARMVDLFMNVVVTVDQRRSGILPPDGNSILKIFANKLFTAAVNMRGFEEARAIALGGLCRIFCSKPYTLFEENYLLNFYHTLQELLKDPRKIQDSAQEQVILNGATLFGCDFIGCRSLIPVFLPHLGVILKKPQNPRLRLAAIKMLCSFVSLEYHFWPNSNFKSNSNISNNTNIKLRTQLSKLNTIIYEAIQTEPNEYNLQKLLWLACVFLQVSSRYISNKRPFPRKLVNIIWTHIQQESQHWPSNVIKTAFNVLSHIMSLANILNKNNENLLNSKLMMEMCNYAKLHLTTGQQFDVDTRRELAAACMRCMLSWMYSYPEIIKKHTVSNHLLGLIRLALRVKVDNKSTLKNQIKNLRNSNSNNIINNSNNNNSNDSNSNNITGSHIWEYAMKSNKSKKKSDPSAVIRQIQRISILLARFIVNDSGGYSGKTNTPNQRFGSTPLNEKYIEDYIFKLLHQKPHNDNNIYKWQPQDRIRHFAYKKNRIFTIIEMPRFEDKDPPSLSLDTQQQQNNEKTSKSPFQTFKSLSLRKSPFNSATKSSNITPTNNNNVSSSVNNIMEPSDFELEQQQHRIKENAKPKLANLIILIRDCHGKYSWEASCIYDDLHNLKPPESPKPKISESRKGRLSTGKLAMDIYGTSIVNSQKKAKEKGFCIDENEKKVSNYSSNSNPIKKQIENSVDSKDSYWSSEFIFENWHNKIKQNKTSISIVQCMKKQQSIEDNTCLFHRKYQKKDELDSKENSEYIVKSNSVFGGLKSKSSKSQQPPFMDKIDMFTAKNKPSVPSQDDAATFMHGRRLLSTLGLIRPSLRNSGLPRDFEILDSNSKLMQSLEDLDSINVLNPISVALLIHNANDDSTLKSSIKLEEKENSLNSEILQLSDLDMLQNNKLSHSNAFDRFLNKLGNSIELDGHSGFTGGITVNDCDTMPYYSDHSNEIAFFVPSLLTKGDYYRRKELYLRNCIRIIWSSSRAPVFLSSKFLASQRYKNIDTPIIYIRITAQKCGLYRISIHGDMVLPHLQDDSDDENPVVSELSDKYTGQQIPATGFQNILLGPLVDGMVISENVLVDLVRQTIINASKLISTLMKESPSDDARLEREKLIYKISDKLSKYNITNIYSNLKNKNNNKNNKGEFYKEFFVDPMQISRRNNMRRAQSNQVNSKNNNKRTLEYGQNSNRF